MAPVSRDGHTASSLLAQVTAQAAARDLTLEEPAIEDVVRRIYGERRGSTR